MIMNIRKIVNVYFPERFSVESIMSSAMSVWSLFTKTLLLRKFPKLYVSIEIKRKLSLNRRLQ